MENVFAIGESVLFCLIWFLIPTKISFDRSIYASISFSHQYTAMSKISYMTQEGYDKLRAELDDFKSDGRRNAAAAIAEAREKGDLSENAEYDAAKNAQGMLEMKINELEKVMGTAQIIDVNQVDTSFVSILNKVKIKNLKANREMEYTLVSEKEASVKEKKISIDSPIGQGLVGKEVGDIAEIQTPGGLMKFEIVNISI